MARVMLRSVVRVRLAAAVAALVLGGLFFGTMTREVGVRSRQGWFVGVGNSCLQFGYNPPRFAAPSQNERGGVYVRPHWRGGWMSEFGFAWRPFRVAAGSEDYFVVPLWQGVALATGAWLWAAGFIGGVRRVRARGCLCCGYDLSLVPEVAGVRRCPECGTRPMDIA